MLLLLEYTRWFPLLIALRKTDILHFLPAVLINLNYIRQYKILLRGCMTIYIGHFGFHILIKYDVILRSGPLKKRDEIFIFYYFSNYAILFRLKSPNNGCHLSNNHFKGNKSLLQSVVILQAGYQSINLYGAIFRPMWAFT